MLPFVNSVDVANRALQHCGATRIDPALGFNEQSKNAAETSFCYDKLRRAELKRNTWAFATKRAVLRPIGTDTRLLAPTMWAAGTTYFIGSIVSDQYSTPWVSRIPDNLANDPQNTTAWQQYFGPLTVSLYDSTLAYFAGELVYTTAGDGTYRVYQSQENGNSDNPATATAYDATAVYMKDQVATYSSVAYMSLIDFNTNQTPSAAPALWAIGTTYASGNHVGGSDGLIYSSVVSSNTGNDPTTDDGTHWQSTGVLNPWTTVFIGGTGSLNWLQIGGAEFPAGVSLSPLAIVYPLGSGPSWQSSTKNAFKLPASYLRKAPQNPKPGVNNLGGPSGSWSNDWELESGFIVSSDAGPIVLRFVADVSDVTLMDDMFCEGLAARVALEVCEPLTQSSDKLKTIAALYKQAISDARTANGIETGTVDPPEDDYLLCRY